MINFILIADESSNLEAAAQKDDENTLLALSLMKKNSYEGFRDFRSVVGLEIL